MRKNEHNEVSLLRPCPEFLLKFTENIQIDDATYKMVSRNQWNTRTSTAMRSFSLTLDSVPALETFLARIEIPYLVPEGILTQDIINQLESFYASLGTVIDCLTSRARYKI